MILGFKKQFEQKIIEGNKIHTIRKDPHDRWKPGRKIHFTTGVRTKNYHQFMEGVCISTTFIGIKWDNGIPTIVIEDDIGLFYPNEDIIERLAKNDGFESVEDFFKWFNKDFNGKIIHWTDFNYN